MQISLPSPAKVTKKEANRAVFEIEGLYPGYGLTLGNALRRVLLSSLSGVAVTLVKIKGVNHEFSTIPHVIEDVVEIMLNLKRLRFKMYSEEPQILHLKTTGEKKVTAKSIECPSQVELVNPELHVATLTDKKADLEMEIQVERGFGYAPVEQRKKGKLEIGAIAVDAIFTPVRKVNYEVENMRVGDRTDYNRLLLDVETDGTVTPSEAFEAAAQILVEQFQVFAGTREKSEEAPKKEKKAKTAAKAKKTTKKK